MQKHFSKPFSLIGTAAVLILLSLFLASCANSESSKPQEAPNSGLSTKSENQTPAKANPIKISIRNSTTRGGLAAVTGEMLKDEGYSFKNNYTIDIGNIRNEEKSCILIPEGNDDLTIEANKLQALLHYPVLIDTYQFNRYRQGENNGGDTNAILIILGQDEIDSSRLDGYTDFISRYDYPQIPYGDGTVLQIEPYDYEKQH